MTGARVFVAICFLVLGASFIASTGVLIHEFASTDWLTMVVAHSHLFFFFPVISILALVAFYLPSVVFTHLYWTHLPKGKIRLPLWLVALAALSLGVSWWLNAKPRAIWEVSPDALVADNGEAVPCAGDGTICRRAPILDALRNIRVEAQSRIGLSPFARNCDVNPLLDLPDDMQKQRWCFPAQAMLTGTACCHVQARFAQAVADLQADVATRSLSGKLDAFFLPLKIFFVLIILTIGGLLAAWRYKLDQHYHDLIPAIERGVIVGAVAMLPWPLMDYAYVQVSHALFGRWSAGLPLKLSLVIAPWLLVLLFYFLRHLGKYSAIAGQITGAVMATVYVLRYEPINDLGVRLLGIGADSLTIACLIAASIAGVFWIVWPRRGQVAMPARMPAE